MHQFGSLSERGGWIFEFASERGGTQKGGGGSNPGGNYAFKVWKLKQKYWFWENGNTFRKNRFFKLIQKQIFQGLKNVKNCILTLNFTFLGQLGSLITSRHAFRSSWNFQKLMQVRYTSDLRTFQVVKIFFPRSGGS